MAERAKADFTDDLKRTKNELDVLFRIPVKEDAERIIEKMKLYNTDVNKSALGDLDNKLLKILTDDFTYISENYKVLNGRKLVPKSLFEVVLEKKREEAKKDHSEASFEKNYKGLFADTEMNAEVISLYEKRYVSKLKSIEESDKEFLERLNNICSRYKSSSDYMERLVKRLLADFNKKNKEDENSDGFQYDLNESTRLLILKHFIRQLGYNDIKAISTPELQLAVNERYGGQVSLIDESVFDLLDGIEAEAENEDEPSVVYTDEYIGSITKLQDTIRLKASLIYVTEDICKRLCSVIRSEALTDKAKDGTAVLLSDCFLMPAFEIKLQDFINYRNITDTGSLDELNELLKERYQNGYLLLTDFSLSERLYTIMKHYGSEALIRKDGKAEKILNSIYGEANRNEKIDIPVSKMVKISAIFDPEKIVYKEITEDDYKTALSIEKNLLEIKEEGASVERIKQIRRNLRKEYTLAVGRASAEIKDKEAGHEISYEDYPLVYRTIVVLSELADQIPFTAENSKLLLRAVPGVEFNVSADAELLSDFLDAKAVNDVKNIEVAEGDEVLEEARRSFLSFVEERVENKVLYAEMLRKRVESKYNNSSKKGGTSFIANKDALYAAKGKLVFSYKLLQIADDLSRAKFSAHGKTREYLYIFAIAFGMTSSGYDKDFVSIDEETKKRVLKKDPRKFTDIQKNLFYDYYSDNIVNNLNTVSGFEEKGTASTIDGYGINYKNFAEAAFLWCIDRKGMTAREKLKLAYKIINHCKKKGMTEEELEELNKKISDDKFTQKFVDQYSYIRENITDVNIFKQYLIENYACKTAGNVMKLCAAGKRAGIQLEQQQERVSKLLKTVEAQLFDSWNSTEIPKIIHDRNKMVAELFITAHNLCEQKCRTCKRGNGKMYPSCPAYFDEQIQKDENGNMQILFTCKDHFPDMKINEEELRRSIKSAVNMYIGEDDDKQFESRITAFSSLCTDDQKELKRVLEEIEERIRLDVLKLEKKKVSRTAILILCYFEMILQNYLYRSFCDDVKMDIEIRSFDVFYRQFCKGRAVGFENYNEETGDDEYIEFVYPGADEILRKSGYQEIDSKNILDIYIIFMAYKDNYKKLYTLPAATELIEDANKKLAELEEMRKEHEANRSNEHEISDNWEISVDWDIS